MEVILFFGFVVLSALFSGFEMAYVSRSRLLHAANLRGPLAFFFGAEPRKVLITILIGNNVVLTGATVTLTHLFMSVMGKAQSAVSAALVATGVLLLFGEALPKALGRTRPQWVVKTFAPVIYFTWKLFRPLVELLDKVVPGSSKEEEMAEALAQAGFEPEAVSIMGLLAGLKSVRLKELARPEPGLRLVDGKALYKPFWSGEEVELPLLSGEARVGEVAKLLAEGPVAVSDGGRLLLVDAEAIIGYFRKNGFGKGS